MLNKKIISNFFLSILLTILSYNLYAFEQQHNDNPIRVAEYGSKAMSTQCSIQTKNLFLERKDFNNYREYKKDLKSDKIKGKINILSKYTAIAKSTAFTMNATHYFLRENDSLIRLTNFQFSPFLFVIFFQCPEVIKQTEIKLKSLYYYNSDIKGYIDDELDQAITEFLQDNNQFVELKKKFTGALYSNRPIIDIINDSKFQDLVDNALDRIIE